MRKTYGPLKAKKCNKGKLCGGSCISSLKVCRKNLTSKTNKAANAAKAKIQSRNETLALIPEEVTSRRDLAAATKKWQEVRKFNNFTSGRLKEFMDAHDSDHIITYAVNNTSPKAIQEKYGWPGRNKTTTDDSSPSIAEELMVRAMGVAAFIKTPEDLNAVSESSWFGRGDGEYDSATSSGFLISITNQTLSRNSKQREHYLGIDAPDPAERPSKINVEWRDKWKEMVTESYNNLNARKDADTIRELLNETYIYEEETGLLRPNSREWVDSGLVAFSEDQSDDLLLRISIANITGTRSTFVP